MSTNSSKLKDQNFNETGRNKKYYHYFKQRWMKAIPPKKGAPFSFPLPFNINLDECAAGNYECFFKMLFHITSSMATKYWYI